MDIKIYDAEAVISKKGGGRKSGVRYANYTKAIAPHIEWLLEQIEKSADDAIRVKVADFAAATGFKMQKVVDGHAVSGPGLNPTSVTWGFKYSLFHSGIVFTVGKVEDGQPVMIMRRKAEGDELPASLKDKTDESVLEGTDETDKNDETDGIEDNEDSEQN